jgi:ribonuclease P protein component
MLPYLSRLKKIDFDTLAHEKKISYHSKNLSINVFRVKYNPSKFAVVVSSSVFKSAVTRNKIKRKIKSYLYKERSKYKNGYAIIIYIKKGTKESFLGSIDKELDSMFNKTNIIKC